MKWLRTLLLISSLTVFLASALYAQDISNKVIEIYFSSVAYPEEFDASIEMLEASGNKNIQSCLISLSNYYFQMGKATMDNCKAAHAGNTQMEWECLKNDPNASMWLWVDGVIRVLRGQSNSWLNTFSGGNMYNAKRYAEQISPGSWVQMVRMGMPLIRQMISCP